MSDLNTGNFKLKKNNNINPSTNKKNDCWELLYKKDDGYGNKVETGFSFSNQIYDFLKGYFAKSFESQKAKLIQEKKDMRDEINSVRRENKKLREALEFYAHPPVTMEDNDYLDDHSIVYHGNLGIEVCGKLARQTLKELRGEMEK